MNKSITVDIYNLALQIGAKVSSDAKRGRHFFVFHVFAPDPRTDRCIAASCIKQEELHTRQHKEDSSSLADTTRDTSPLMSELLGF